MLDRIKPIAIYLPQFHPIPENDLWWGKGFTEWTNVTKAQPRFEGHYQPHLPADLGFYDLRVEESRLAQEIMAKDYGIYGFCYYHYWFNGKRILDEPLKRKLKNPKEDFPFMLCWANENWTRAWDGLEKEVLLYQDYNDEDDIAHMNHLCQTYFSDSRYIRHDGKPVFLIYRPHLFKDIKKTIQVWREVAKKNGIGELHIGYMQSWATIDNYKETGFDFASEFQPNFGNAPLPKENLLNRIINKFKKKLRLKSNPKKNLKDKVLEFDDFVKQQKKLTYHPNISPSITPMWDNSSRRKTNATIFTNSTPEIYGDWLKHILKNYPWQENTEKFLFINAWNEWAEGNHIEPCQKWGKQYLEMTKKVLSERENE
jgi:lipopolysaccharide biosynthesis protein